MRARIAVLLALFPSWALATPLTLLGVGGAGVAALSPFDLSYVTSAADTSASTTYTFSAQSVGTDVSGADKRYTVIGAGSSNSPGAASVSSATICGVAATKLVTDTVLTASAAIFLADTSGLGTSCTIAVTFSGARASAGIGVWRVINPASTTPDGNTCVNSSSPLTVSINILAGGSALAYAYARGPSITFTWSGLTEDFDAATVAGTAFHSGAHGGSAGSPATITATPSAGSNNQACSVSFH